VNFSEIIKNKLNEENIKITDLAKKTGYSVQYMSDLIAGKRRWNESTITKVSDVLGIKIEFNTKSTKIAKDELAQTGTD